jgi:hypothetical protein
MLYKGKGPAITDPLSGPLYITSSLGNKYTQSSMKMKLDDDEIKKLLATQTVTLVDSGIARWPGETMVIERQEIWHQERVSLLMVHAYYDTKGEDFWAARSIYYRDRGSTPVYDCRPFFANDFGVLLPAQQI